LGAWLADRDRPGRPGQQQRRRAVAVDGKTLRGAKRRDGRQVHLLATMDHATRAVLAQRQVDGAPGEVQAWSRCWPIWISPAPWSPPTRCTPTPTPPSSWWPASRPTTCCRQGQPAHAADRCARIAWHRVPELDRTRDRGHGRVELRILKAVTVSHFGFPHAAQVLQVTRTTRELGTRGWRTVVVDAITSLTHAHANPARLADLLRGHWGIENGLHWCGM
jgi:hypothetical protein